MALPTQAEVDRLLIAYESAIYEAERVAEISLVMEQKTETDYTTVWNNELNEG